MSALITQEVGKLWVPSLEAVRFLPGQSAGRRSSHQALVTIAVREAGSGRIKQAGYAAGMIMREGLEARLRASEEMQRQFADVEAVLAAMQHRMVLKSLGLTHNERTQNGARMISKSFWGTSASPSNATVNAPTRIALANANITATYTDLSLGSASANVTTNEATANGMVRTAALTPSGLTDATAFDGQYQLTISNVFTDTTASSTIWAAALVDNTTAAFNMFAEATFTSATLAIGDTLTVTWTCKF